MFLSGTVMLDSTIDALYFKVILTGGSKLRFRFTFNVALLKLHLFQN